jgi:mRNA interferase RelE/StbE
MSYSLSYTSRALRDLKALPRQDQERIIKALESITDNPSAYVHALEGVQIWSFRVGRYRVLLDIRRQNLLIFVVGVGHRRNIYHRI